jgi:hypothetical protein
MPEDSTIHSHRSEKLKLKITRELNKMKVINIKQEVEI